MRPNCPKLPSLALKIDIAAVFSFASVVIALKGNSLLKFIHIHYKCTTDVSVNAVVAIKHSPTLHYSVVYIFLILEIFELSP